MKESFADVKIGDKIIVFSAGSLRGRRRVETVTGATASRIVVGSQSFNRDRGDLRGEKSRWHFTCLELATPERVSEIESRRRRYDVAGFGDWTNCDQATIDAVHALIFPTPADQAGKGID